MAKKSKKLIDVLQDPPTQTRMLGLLEQIFDPYERKTDPLSGLEKKPELKLTELEVWKRRALTAEFDAALIKIRLHKLELEVLLPRVDPKGEIEALRKAKAEAEAKLDETMVGIINLTKEAEKRLGLEDINKYTICEDGTLKPIA